MRLAASNCGNALHKVKDAFQLATFFAKNGFDDVQGSDRHRDRPASVSGRPRRAAGQHANSCEAGGDFFRTKTLLFRQLLEGLELIGGMHIFPRDVLVYAAFVRIICSVDDAAHGLGLVDLLPLRSQKPVWPSEKPRDRPSLSNSGSTTRFCKISWRRPRPSRFDRRLTVRGSCASDER